MGNTLSGPTKPAPERCLPRQGRRNPAPQLKVYHKLLSNPGMRYEDLGPDYYERQAATRRKISRPVREIEAEGFEVTLCRTPEPGPGPRKTTPHALTTLPDPYRATQP